MRKGSRRDEHVERFSSRARNRDQPAPAPRCQILRAYLQKTSAPSSEW